MKSRIFIFLKNIYVKMMIYALFLWGLFSYTFSFFSINIVSNINIIILSFFVEYSYKPIRFYEYVLSEIHMYNNLLKENDALIAEIDKLKASVYQQELQIENLKTVKTVLDTVTETLPVKKVVKILGSISSFPQVLMYGKIDKEAEHLKDAMVYTDKGLLGRVVEHFPGKVQILAITDHLSRIPIRCRRTGIPAIIVGNGSNEMDVDITDTLIDSLEESLSVGDILYTSGIDDVFVSDIPVAKISSLKNGEIKATPIENIANIQFACVQKKSN